MIFEESIIIIVINWHYLKSKQFEVVFHLEFRAMTVPIYNETNYLNRYLT